METLEELQLTHVSSELVAFLELKASWISLRKQLKVALYELLLLERDPGFSMDSRYTEAELKARCARIQATRTPASRRWYSRH